MIRRSLKVVCLVLLVAMIPAAFIFLSSVWTVKISADKIYEDQAMGLLVEETRSSSERQRRIASLSSFPEPEFKQSGVINIAPPEPRPQLMFLRFPPCQAPAVIENEDKLRMIRAVGHPFIRRRYDVGEATNIVVARSLGLTHLALLNSCLTATPFAARCGDWLDRQILISSDSDVIAQLKNDGKLHVSDEGLCWPDREAVGPTELQRSQGTKTLTRLTPATPLSPRPHDGT